MKRILTALVMCGASTGVFSQTSALPSGANLTHGNVSSPYNLSAYSGNPATGVTLLFSEKRGFGMSIVNSVGVALEFGPIEQIYNNIDGIQQRLDAVQSSFLSGSATPDLSVVEALKNDADNLLAELGDSFYMDAAIGVQPLGPFVTTGPDLGSLVFDLGIDVQAKIGFLDAPLALDFLAAEGDQIQTNSAAYLKVGGLVQGSVSYSKEVYELPEGIIYGGFRLAYYQVLLTKNLISFQEFSDATTLLEDNMSDAISGGGKAGIGLDIGALFVTPHYQVGGTLKNINAPSFDYPTIGNNCTDDACFAALAFSDEIDLKETYTMFPQLNLEASLYSLSRMWAVSTSLEVNPIRDMVANEYQWFTVSSSFIPKLWSKWFWAPGVRVGYRQNLVGTQMNYLTFGISWLIAHIDIAYGLKPFDTSQIQGLEDVPFAARGIALNAGINFMF